MLESKSSSNVLVVDTWGCSSVRFVNFVGFILNFNVSIGTMSTFDNNNAVFLVSWCFYGFFLSKGQHSWSIIIHDSNSAAGVLTNKSDAICHFIKFNKEVLIWFPIFIVNNFYLNFCLFFSKSAAIEFNDLINGNVVLG